MQEPYHIEVSLQEYYRLIKSGKWIIPDFSDKCLICGAKDCAEYHGKYERGAICPVGFHAHWDSHLRLFGTHCLMTHTRSCLLEKSSHLIWCLGSSHAQRRCRLPRIGSNMLCVHPGLDPHLAFYGLTYHWMRRPNIATHDTCLRATHRQASFHHSITPSLHYFNRTTSRLSTGWAEAQTWILTIT